jgi:hypothetical protein
MPGVKFVVVILVILVVMLVLMRVIFWMVIFPALLSSWKVKLTAVIASWIWMILVFTGVTVTSLHVGCGSGK